MSLFSAVYQSMVNPAAYASFRRQSLGRAFLYLLLVTALFNLIFNLSLIYNYNSNYKKGLAWLEAAAPEFVFQNGELTAQGKMPIVASVGRDALFIIDTSGQTGPDILKDRREGALITKDKIIYKKSSYETREYDLGAYRAFNFNKGQMIGFLAAARPFFYIGLLLAIFLTALASHLIAALFIALLGLLLYFALKVRVSFGDLYKLAIYAMTGPTLLFFLLDLFGSRPPFLFSFLSLVYLYLASKSLRAAD
jgi:hypothetical protein